MPSSSNNMTPTNQTSLNDQPFSNDKALFNNQTIVVQVSMDKSSHPGQPSKIAGVSDSSESKEFEGNNPTPDLTTENIDKLESLLDYGLQRWISQQKQEDGVAVYGI